MSTELVATTTPDLADIRADDTLLDTLGGREDRPAAEELVDDDLCALLLEWRRETDRRPMPVLVDTPNAVAVLEQARRASRPTPRARAARFVSRLTRRTR